MQDRYPAGPQGDGYGPFPWHEASENPEISKDQKKGQDLSVPLDCHANRPGLMGLLLPVLHAISWPKALLHGCLPRRCTFGGCAGLFHEVDGGLHNARPGGQEGAHPAGGPGLLEVWFHSDITLRSLGQTVDVPVKGLYI